MQMRLVHLVLSRRSPEVRVVRSSESTGQTPLLSLDWSV